MKDQTIVCPHQAKIKEIKEVLIALAANELCLKNQNDRLFEMMKRQTQTEDEQLNNMWKSKYLHLKQQNDKLEYSLIRKDELFLTPRTAQKSYQKQGQKITKSEKDYVEKIRSMSKERSLSKRKTSSVRIQPNPKFSKDLVIRIIDQRTGFRI